MIRNFILFSLVILFGSIIAVFAFTEGWIRIVVTPKNFEKRIDNNEKLNQYETGDGELIDQNFSRNPSFSIVKHQIQPGETLFDLENRYGTNWKVIQKLNKIDDPNRLQPGKIIRIPVRIVES